MSIIFHIFFKVLKVLVTIELPPIELGEGDLAQGQIVRLAQLKVYIVYE